MRSQAEKPPFIRAGLHQTKRVQVDGRGRSSQGKKMWSSRSTKASPFSIDMDESASSTKGGRSYKASNGSSGPTSSCQRDPDILEGPNHNSPTLRPYTMDPAPWKRPR